MALIDKDDIELELQTALSSTYTDAMIQSIAEDAEANLKLQTHRTSFTGSAENLAKKYVLYRAIDRLITTNPDLVKTDVTKISEGGDSIDFAASGRTLRDYATEARSIQKQLTITTAFSGYTYTNENTFYSEEDST